jgi:methionyl aminopeptidase
LHYRVPGAPPFPGTVCTSVNEVIVHGIPGKRILHEGDIISVDIGAVLDGYVGDSAWTYGVGHISPGAQRLLKVTQECLWAALGQARAGNRLGDIGHAIQSHAEANGFGVVRKYISHGVGRKLHEDPEIRNYGDPGKGMLLRPGMTMAIEPMITDGNYESVELDDGWTVVTIDGKLSAHFEHTIAITPEGEPEIMTLRVD